MDSLTFGRYPEQCSLENSIGFSGHGRCPAMPSQKRSRVFENGETFFTIQFNQS